MPPDFDSLPAQDAQMLVASGILPLATLVHPCTAREQGRAQAKDSAGAATAQAHSDRLCALIHDEIEEITGPVLTFQHPKQCGIRSHATAQSKFAVMK